MAIERLTPEAEINRYLAAELAKRERALVRNARYIGERAVAEARSSGSYRDQTGNLRSSVGYTLLHDGRPVGEAGFAGRGGAGAQRGKAFCQRVIRRFRQGVALVVVAGMPYASHVAALGYNVLDSAQLEAERGMRSLAGRFGGRKR